MIRILITTVRGKGVRIELIEHVAGTAHAGNELIGVDVPSALSRSTVAPPVATLTLWPDRRSTPAGGAVSGLLLVGLKNHSIWSVVVP